MRFMCKTPLRVSLFGGGSDYMEYLEDHNGAVLGGTINQYVYIFALQMSGLAPKKFKLSYRHTEEVDSPTEFDHPVVRAVLEEMDWQAPINIATMSDLPGGTGLGSSSSFTVGILNLLHHIADKKLGRLALAKEAIRIEHDVLGENVGVQDQLHAAFGGFNLYKLKKSAYSIQPLNMTQATHQSLNDHIIMVYSGTARHASQVVGEQVELTKKKINTGQIEELVSLAYEAADVLCGTGDSDDILKEVGKMLHQAWLIKRSLAPGIANSGIDEIYEESVRMGALGGKLCGAGGGGFVAFLVPPQKQPAFYEKFAEKNVIKVSFTDHGSVVNLIG